MVGFHGLRCSFSYEQWATQPGALATVSTITTETSTTTTAGPPGFRLKRGVAIERKALTVPPLLSKFLAPEISSACSCLQLKSPISTITSTVPVVVGSHKHHSFELSRLSLQLTLLFPQVTTTTTISATTTSTSTTVYTTSTSTTTTIVSVVVDPFVCFPVGALCNPLAGQCCSGSCGTTDPNVPLHCCVVTSIPGGEQIDC
jgi:hypothetical protein